MYRRRNQYKSVLAFVQQVKEMEGRKRGRKLLRLLSLSLRRQYHSN